LNIAPAASLGLDATAKCAKLTAFGITMTERVGISLCSAIARRGTLALLADRVRKEFGAELPRRPRSSGSGPIKFVWAGPNHWLVLSEIDDGRSLERRLSASLGSVASLTDLSDGRAILRLTGVRAREVLAKGVHIDLHPRVFGPDDTMATIIAHINVHLWQVNDAPTYDMAMFRSFAVAFCDWLSAAASFP
jgi:sarcosine oxidase subunit gamma